MDKFKRSFYRRTDNRIYTVGTEEQTILAISLATIWIHIFLPPPPPPPLLLLLPPLTI
jgi:hypothetical protein